MENLTEGTLFAFVNYDGPSLPCNPNVRRVIKRQAMRDVAAARKQSGTYGKHNLGQDLLSLKNNHALRRRGLCLADTAPSAYRLETPHKSRIFSDNNRLGKPGCRSRAATTPSRCGSLSRIPCSGSTISESEFLLLEFVPLTGLRLGLTTPFHLEPLSSRTRDRLPIPQLGTRKLLSFIPSRYHEVPLLRHATNCVVAKLRQKLQGPKHWPSDGEANILLHYTSAVRELRVALEDDDQRLAPETLCTVELLGAFEVMNSHDDSGSWLHHVAGAARLVEARGGQKFETEFEMALFLTSIGSTVMEAFLSNQACFLEEVHWQQVLRQAVSSDSSIANQKDIVFALWHYLFAGPRLFKETTNAILGPNTPESVVEELINHLLDARIGLSRWLSQARQLRLDSDNITQLTLRGTFTTCHILKTRLLYALAPSRFAHLESECQKLAEDVIASSEDLWQEGHERLKWTSFVSQSVWLAKGIKATNKSWSEGSQSREGAIEKWKFQAWCKAMGRQCPSP